MKTNLNLSSKMHIFIIVTSVIIAIGVAVGVICHAVAGRYFNYYGDLASYKSVTVTYSDIDFSNRQEDPQTLIDDICESAFKSVGVDSYSKEYGEKSGGDVITYKFVDSTDSKKLESAVAKINEAIDAELQGDSMFSNASWNTVSNVYADSKALVRGGIVLASIVVFHFLYFIIRYKLSAAFAALLADAHNFALYLSLLAITRVPVTSSIVTFAIITVLITMIQTCFLFDKMRRNLKTDDKKSIEGNLIVDKTADETFILNTLIPVCVAVVAVVIFVLMSISSLSPLAIMAPVFMALISCISCVYGAAIFVPAVYSRFKQIGDNYKATHTRKAKSKKTDK